MNSQNSKANYGRRSFLLQTTAAASTVALSFRNNLRAQGSLNFKLSMCNEAFASANEKKSFPETCKAIRKAGYTGIEVAPFSLSDDPIAITAARRREYSDAIKSEGLTFVGLHWLLLAPKGLNVVTSDKVVREKSWRHMSNLIDLCADLGQNGIMVLGSPDQRKVTGEVTRAEAVKNYTDGLAGIAPHAVKRGVKVLIETFSERKEDVAVMLADAYAIVRQIDSPGIQMMFDCNNESAEAESHSTLVERYFDHIKHVHITEHGGPYPGTGTYDYKQVLNILHRRGYTGWLSVEVFDFSAGADKIARESLKYVQSEIAKLDRLRALTRSLPSEG